jgi:hypothetical protein
MLFLIVKILQGEWILFKRIRIAQLQSQLQVSGKIAIGRFQMPALVTIIDFRLDPYRIILA